MKKNEDSRKKWAHVLAKAWMDEKFKRHLIASPQQALKECGIQMDKNINYKVLEDTDRTHHLVIPQKPEGILSETELLKIAAAGTGGDSCTKSDSCI